jgi:GTP-binding protein HflX
LDNSREQLTVKRELAILVGAYKTAHEASRPDNLAELTALAETAGAIIVSRFQQKLRDVHPATYIGRGKAEQLRDRVVEHKADVVIFDNDLSPGQIRQLEEIVEAKVIDRSELILDIFATRAKTRQSKLQVELAQLEYTYPRLTRMWGHLDSVAGAGGATAAGAVGGIGTRGTGEKQLEIDRRLVTRRITELKRQLEEIDERKLREIDGRREHFKICLVGYTNAGKSTLMNALTGADVFVEDRLFATLDTRTRKWTLEGSALPALLSDTVGFVSHLPHHLVASFKATLEEAVNADLLLHVVDASNLEVFDQIDSVDKVLSEIGCGQKDMLVVLNKCDAIRDMSIFESLQTVQPQAACISARTGLNLDTLIAAVQDRIRRKQSTIRIVCDIADGKLQSFLHSSATILRREFTDDAVHIEASIGPAQLAQLRRFKPRSLDVV